MKSKVESCGSQGGKQRNDRRRRRADKIGAVFAKLKLLATLNHVDAANRQPLRHVERQRVETTVDFAQLLRRHVEDKHALGPAVDRGVGLWVSQLAALEAKHQRQAVLPLRVGLGARRNRNAHPVAVVGRNGDARRRLRPHRRRRLPHVVDRAVLPRRGRPVDHARRRQVKRVGNRACPARRRRARVVRASRRRQRRAVPRRGFCVRAVVCCAASVAVGPSCGGVRASRRRVRPAVVRPSGGGVRARCRCAAAVAVGPRSGCVRTRRRVRPAVVRPSSGGIRTRRRVRPAVVRPSSGGVRTRSRCTAAVAVIPRRGVVPRSLRRVPRTRRDKRRLSRAHREKVVVLVVARHRVGVALRIAARQSGFARVPNRTVRRARLVRNVAEARVVRKRTHRIAHAVAASRRVAAALLFAERQLVRRRLCIQTAAAAAPRRRRVRRRRCPSRRHIRIVIEASCRLLCSCLSFSQRGEFFFFFFFVIVECAGFCFFCFWSFLFFFFVLFRVCKIFVFALSAFSLSQRVSLTGTHMSYSPVVVSGSVSVNW